MIASISKCLLVDTNSQKELYNIMVKNDGLVTSLMAIDPPAYFIS